MPSTNSTKNAPAKLVLGIIWVSDDPKSLPVNEEYCSNVIL